MSSSNVTISPDTQNEINTINSFIISLARWVYPTVLVIGIISNILNIYVFTRPTLKRNPCCMYFLSSSIAALVYITINVPLRILQMGYKIDPTAYSIVVCKIKSFFVYTWRALTLWYLVLASIDRYLHSSSNANLRKWSSFKVAICIIPLTFILAHLAYSHVIIFYEILLPNRTCSIENAVYSIFLGIWHLITYGTGPPLVMLIFCLLTIKHIRHRQIIPVTNNPNQGNRDFNKDRNLLRMVLIQCLIIGLTTTAYAISQWYTTLTSNEVKNSLQLTIENLCTNLVGIISAAAVASTFFIFTLASRMFRQQLLCQRRQRI